MDLKKQKQSQICMCMCVLYLLWCFCSFQQFWVLWGTMLGKEKAVFLEQMLQKERWHPVAASQHTNRITEKERLGECVESVFQLSDLLWEPVRGTTRLWERLDGSAYRHPGKQRGAQIKQGQTTLKVNTCGYWKCAFRLGINEDRWKKSPECYGWKKYVMSLIISSGT